LLIIDLKEIENLFNSVTATKCTDIDYYKPEAKRVDEIVKSIKLSDLIKKAILETCGDNGYVIEVKSLGHYINQASDIIYIVSQYKLSQRHKKTKEYVGMFSVKITNEVIYCKLLKYKYLGDMKSRKTIGVDSRKNNVKNVKHPISISNLEPYVLNNIKSNKINNLDIAYISDRSDYFISFKYNRRSCQMPQKLEDDRDENIKYYLEPLGNIIWVKEDNGEEKYGIFYFILSDMFFVRKMEVVEI
jgi:hypothetical protein